MDVTIQNIAKHDLRLSINKLFDASNAAELTQNAFSIFVSEYGFSSASIFLLDKQTFGFDHFLTEGNESSEETIKYFNILVDKGIVAQTINLGAICRDKILNGSNTALNGFVFPLITKEELLGMILFIGSDNFDLDVESQNSLEILAKVFTSLLNNFELKREVTRVQELSAIDLAERTQDIIQSSRELKIILDYLHVGIFITDKATGEIADVNLMAQKIIGLSKEEIIGKRRIDFLYFADETEDFSKITSTTEGLLQKSDGSIIPIIQKSTELTLNKEDFIIDNFVDISDRKAMEVELKRAHDELEQKVLMRTIELTKTNSELKKQINERIKADNERLKLYWAVHQSPSIVIITDVAGKVEYVNPAFEKITGYASEEVLGKIPRILKSGFLSNSDYINLWNNLKDGAEWKSEIMDKDKDGAVYWISLTISPVKNHYGEISNFLIIQEDITEKKKAEKELIRAKEKAEDSAKFKSSLLSKMSHEFRTPFISIIGFADCLNEELEDVEFKEMAKDISDSGKRLLNTLNNVLLISQAETIRNEMVFQQVNIYDLLEDVLAPFIMDAERRKIKIMFNIPETPLLVSTDQILFKEMISRIIDNALKYTNQGQVILNVRLDGRENNKMCVIECEDTGIGIAENDLESIFESFKQVSEGQSRKYDGTGLGLTIAKKIAEAMHGTIKVQSEIEKGSTFTVEIPVSQETQDNFDK